MGRALPSIGADRFAHREWYARTRPTYEALVKVLSRTLLDLLAERSIGYLSVAGRAKTVDSFADKIDRKSYQNPREEIHDFAGVRVIVYTESDVSKTVELIKSTFNVHYDKSLDKTEELGVDRTGYRSVHLVCDLGSPRCQLPEYARFQGLLVEIQVRTVLQHAWAEIEHDRNYKFSGVLPARLQRRFHLAAGTLEMLDREFDSIARAIDEYSGKVVEATQKGDLDIPIDSKSLGGFLLAKFANRIRKRLTTADEEVVSELDRFGIRTLHDLDKLLTKEFLRAHRRSGRLATDSGFVRAAMLFCDATRYFSDAWQQHWRAMKASTRNLLVEKHGETKINQLLSQYGIQVVDCNVFGKRKRQVRVRRQTPRPAQRVRQEGDTGEGGG